MQRKPGFPVANCNIKMPDSMMAVSESLLEEEEPLQRRQQLINFGHSQWGFNNWSWAVTKQDLDFVDLSNGKYTAGVAAFVSVTVKNLEIHRENVGYATSVAPNKGAAIHRSRKCAVTNALRETLLSFGGSVATDLTELLETQRAEAAPLPAPAAPAPPPLAAPDPPEPHKHAEPKNSPKQIKTEPAANVRAQAVGPPAVKNAANPPVAKAHPMPANLPPAANRPPVANAPRPPPPPLPPAPHVRPNSNEAKLDGLSEEEARAERKRRQRIAQEEFRIKQLLKQKELDVSQHVNCSNSSGVDDMLMAIPTQDIVIEQTGSTVRADKRKSPVHDGGAAKRRSTPSKLDIVQS